MQLLDKSFETYISHDQILNRVGEIAAELNNKFEDKNPLFVAVLNGSFMFAADLMKEVNIPSEITFIRLKSYEDLETTGNVKQLIGLSETIFQRNVILLEDIIDTGKTLSFIKNEFEDLGASTISVVSLLYKPKSSNKSLTPDITGFEIDDKFVVGYGLDYNGYGRNLKDLYQLSD